MSYGIAYLGSNLPFEVHAITGEIRVISQLDYLVQDKYEFVVQANYGGFTASATVEINIIDSPNIVLTVNCHPPYPEIKVIQFSENELAENSTQWINCTIFNNPNQTIIYYFSPPSPVSINNGFIHLTEALDYENQSSYDLMVFFTDTANNPLQGNYTIKLLVLPVNEYAPIFLNEMPLEYQISESAKVGTLVSQLLVTDKDGGIDGDVRYDIISGNGSDTFIIDTITGELYNSIELDREEESVYNITVVAYDTPPDKSNTLSSFATVFISVFDENDNAPIFDKAIYFAEVPENKAISSPILTLNCTDSDMGVNSAITYHLIDPNGHFVVDEISGVLTVAGKLDYESSLIHYELLVQCFDDGEPRLTSETLIIVDITSINEYDPTLDEDKVMLFTVREDAVPGTIIGTVNAADEDDGLAGELVYELIYSTNCPNVLVINQITGELCLTRRVDYDHPIVDSNIMDCFIFVRDKQTPVRTANATVSITITNVNDNPPSCSPSAVSTVVSEDVLSGAVVSVLSCSDLDNDTLIYSIEESSDHFAMSNESLVLNGSLDYEINKTFIIVISASDGYFSSAITYFILVAPINEHPPIFTNEVFHCNVSEVRPVGYLVCTISASDGDSGMDGMISYSLEDFSDTFLINSITGDVLLKQTLDYETVSNYELAVFARDSSATNIQFISSAILNITVEDYNDNNPSMAPISFTSISENAENEVVTILNCTDLDTVSNDLLVALLSVSEVYRNNFGHNNDDPPFYIEANTLYTNGSIDYETTKMYQLTLACYDGGEPQLSSTSTITVYVDEENEFTPYFISPISNKLMLDYSLDVEVGEVLYMFQASDDDSGLSGDILYLLSFDSLEHVPFLSIGATSGQLIIQAPLTCAYGDVLQYTVIVTDGGLPPLATSMKVIINIVDCELAQPTASATVYTVTLEETAMQGTIVARVLCTSPTPHLLPDTATIHYTIVDNTTSWFSIDTVTGQILVSGTLDYETSPVVTLHVQCYYSHDSLNYNLQLTVNVNLLPQNEHAPTFSQSYYSLTLEENTIPGDVISTILATDNDYGRDGDIQYNLLADGPFMLHPQTAELYLIDYLDREMEKSFDLIIIAKDNPVNATHTRLSSATVNVTVTDVNDNRPQCVEVIYYSTITPRTPVGALLHTLNCTDPDEGENGTLKYSIDQVGSTLWPVLVDTTSGSVHVARALTENTPPSYTVPVMVTDMGIVGLSTVVYVVLTVDLATKDVVELDEAFLSVADKEGWSNNVTVSIKDMWSHLVSSRINSTDDSHTCILLYSGAQRLKNFSKLPLSTVLQPIVH